MKHIIDTELDSIREAGTWKHERIITTPQAASIRVRGSKDNILNFCANNYLGLSVSMTVCISHFGSLEVQGYPYRYCLGCH